MGLLFYILIGIVTAILIWILFPVLINQLDGPEAARKLLNDSKSRIHLCFWGIGVGAIWPVSLSMLGFIGTIFLIGFIGYKLFQLVMKCVYKIDHKEKTNNE